MSYTAIAGLRVKEILVQLNPSTTHRPDPSPSQPPPSIGGNLNGAPLRHLQQFADNTVDWLIQFCWFCIGAMWGERFIYVPNAVCSILVGKGDGQFLEGSGIRRCYSPPFMRTGDSTSKQPSLRDEAHASAPCFSHDALTLAPW